MRKLAARIDRQGPLTFAEFMEAALYDPEFGYYSSAADLGPHGDYCTSPDVHPIFARLISRQIAQVAESVAPDGDFTIVEMGAGRGTFAAYLLSAYQQEYPALLARLRYIIVERSARMARQQEDRLRPILDQGASVRWLSSLTAFPPDSVGGVMFSNELVDAFPVHRVVMRPLGLREIFVGWSQEGKGGRFIEIEAPPAAPDLAQYFERIGVHLKNGQRAEVNLLAVDWMREVGSRLRKGVVFTIDYGHTAADLYSQVRRKGTLLCYYQQTVSDDPYNRVGQQDMTAHVDFTSLALAGEEAGLEVTGFTNQLHFLIGLGIDAAFADLDPESPESAWMRSLLRPDGMGGTYKILVQHKGMPVPVLDGLRSRPFFSEALFTGLPRMKSATPRSDNG